jgi:hypothetical protein
LFEAANEPKQFLLFNGAEHCSQRPPQYYDKLREFLKE